MDAINDKFAEARDEIDYANEDAESTYFDESYKSAQTATDEVCCHFCRHLTGIFTLLMWCFTARLTLGCCMAV